MTAVGVAEPTTVLATASYVVWRGWRAHAGRQAELPEPQWLDRVIASGLETLSRASVAPGSDSAPDAERRIGAMVRSATGSS